MNKKYNYFYLITNKLNGKFYYGVHSTDNLNDGYMGSGTILKKAIKKYGIENFNKEIVAFFDTREELLEHESYIVNDDMITNPKCYNVAHGGKNSLLSLISVLTENGYALVTREEYEKGNYKRNATGKTTVVDENGNKLWVDIDSEETKKYKNIQCGSSLYWINGERKRLKVNDERVLSGEAISISHNTITAKDKDENFYRVSLDDIRLKNGELLPIWSGRKHTQETKQKISDTSRRLKLQYGEKNSQYGTMWINKNNKNKKIKKEELLFYKNDGWVEGRCVKCTFDYNAMWNDRQNGMTYKDIAAKYNCGLTTVKKAIKTINNLNINE